MNKSELIDYIATSADISRSAAERALKAFMDAVTESLKGDQPLALVGFGSFVVRTRAARKARNPQTGAVVDIKEARVPSFKAGKLLKDAVQSTGLGDNKG